jgi:acyl-CoA dehydrogenase
MSGGPLDVLDLLARKPDGPTWRSVEEASTAYSKNRGEGQSPFASAVDVAARADRLAQAFAVGYLAALERLVPGVPLPCALCVTEKGGNGPRAIKASLRAEGEGYRLDGEKSFVTFGTRAKTLLVAARAGTKADGRPDLAVVRIPADRAGIVVEELPPTSFVPEVSHARLTLDGVPVAFDERLPGDGYLQHVKPFRTIEDIHVLGATLAYVIGWTRRARVEPELVAELSAILIGLAALQDAKPLDPRVHLALHGCYQQVAQAFASDGLASLLRSASSEERARWERDRPLLGVASKAREARFEAAKRALGLGVG